MKIQGPWPKFAETAKFADGGKIPSIATLFSGPHAGTKAFKTLLNVTREPEPFEGRGAEQVLPGTLAQAKQKRWPEPLPKIVEKLGADR